MDIDTLFDKPDCAALCVGDIKILCKTILAAIRTPDPGAYITRRELCRHFHCGEQRIATALHRAKLQPTQIGRAQKYPRALAIAALAPHLYN